MNKVGYMDGIDWQHHLGEDPKGVMIYPSVKDTRRGEACLRGGGGCGIVKVEIRQIEWTEEQDL
jgi:hypothetical protein